MRNLRKFILILGLVLFMVLTGCSTNQNSSKDTQNNQNETAKNDGKIIDREGNEVILPEKTDKIVSLSSSITETLLNLGLADNLVAVDIHSAKIEGVPKDLPQFDMLNPEVETIISASPDIIFASNLSKPGGNDPFAKIIDMGTFITVIPTSTSVQGIKDDILFIGDVTNKEKEAQKIVDEYQAKIDNILEQIKDLKPSEPISVYFETSPAPSAYTFGKNTFLNDMLNSLGAKNIFDDVEGWLPVSQEQVVSKNPSVIFTNADYLETPIEDIKNRTGWENIDAIKNNRVYLIPQNSSARANENSIIAFESMAKALYPELTQN